MYKHQAVDASEYESELIYLTRQIKGLEKDLEDILDEDLKTRIEEGLLKLRDRVAELEAYPPTPAQTLEWLHGIEERLRTLTRKRMFRDPETRKMLAVVHNRISELEESAGKGLGDETNADMLTYARNALTQPDIISDEMLLAEVERRGLRHAQS